MPVTGLSSEEVEMGPDHGSPLARLLAGYRPVAEVEAADLERTRSAVTAGEPWRRDSPLHVTVSALILHPPTRRVLLRWHARERAWLHVGGHADPGETQPLQIALREGAEETGLPDLVPWPDAGLLHLVVVPVSPAGGEPAHEHADLRFGFATAQPEVARPERPGAAVRWLTLPEARELTTEANLRESLHRVEGLLARADQPATRQPPPAR